MKTCKERLPEYYNSRMNDLRVFLKDLEGNDETGSFYDYGLDFSYVEPNTFDDQPTGYFRYQLSWGGPSDEFRIFVDDMNQVNQIEYWFLDWFDGSNKIVTGDDFETIVSLLEPYLVREEV